MCRLAIFVFYDSEGKVDEYIYYLLQEINNVVSKLVVIINGKILSESKKSLERYSRDIIERENNGLDGGAFKEYFTSYIREEELLKYDEIIILNDSFYGPVFSIENIFNEMRNVKCDYWGMTRHNGHHDSGYNISSHIQGYFLVFRKRIIHDECFLEFWEQMETPNNYDQAVKNYEIGINTWLDRHGYRGISYVDYKGGTNLINECINPFMEEPYKLIKECGCPVLKRKAISILNEEGIKAVKYIEGQTSYDTKMIWNNWERKVQTSEIKSESIERINDFCKRYDSVYIYGKGKVGESLRHVLELLEINITGYVVSEGSDESGTLDIACLNGIEKVGIIIGVGRMLFDEVYAIAAKTVGKSNVFVINELRGHT